MIGNNRSFISLLLLWLIVFSFPQTSSSETTENLFYQGESCYQNLAKSSTKQKYRQYWLTCIEKFQDVYRREPTGPWAAAGLYMSGRLYLELHQRSGIDSDLNEARDHFGRITRRFPQSAYAPKAKKALASARAKGEKAGGTPKKTARKSVLSPSQRAKITFHQAEACYQNLLNAPQKQKYRDAWMPCIDRFHEAYTIDPGGPWAAPGLYMEGRLYHGLYQVSFRDGDKKAALDRFEQIRKGFPQSDYRKRAERAIQAIEDDEALSALIAFSGAGDDNGVTDREEDSSPDAARAATDARKNGSGSESRVEVTGLRFWSNPKYTRLVIDISADSSFSYNMLRKDPSLKKPPRLYVDVHNARLGKELQKIIPIDDNLLELARAGQFSSDSVRIVADIKSYKDYKVFSLKDPFRIVMDVWGTGNGPARESAVKIEPKHRTINPKESTKDLAKQLGLGVRRIVVDPGHGGKDYGAPGAMKGVHEKHVVMEISKRLAGMLRKQLQCEVILTRSNDRYMTLEERTAFANTKNADLFISIHTNANRDRRAYGIATSTNNISDLETILYDLMNNAKINESSRLAAYIQDSLTGHLKAKGWPQVKSKGVKKAPFYVLIGAQMPSVLIETSFISNPRECRRLLDPQYQKRLCEGIIKGVERYIENTTPTALIQPKPPAKKKG